MAVGGLILLVAITLGLTEFFFLGWSKSGHSSLLLHPEGESLAPSFRGIPGNYFLNKQKLWISYISHKSLQQPATGNIYLIHGLGGYLAKLDELAASFSRAGFNVFAMEYQGYGRSEGDKKHLGGAGIKNVFDDFVEFTDHITKTEEVAQATKKNYCFGKSMGGIVVMATTMTSKVCQDGLILAAPALNMTKLEGTISTLLPHLSTFLPKAPVQVVDGQTYLRARAFWTMTTFISEELPKLLSAHGSSLPPFLLLQGEEDSITVPSTSVDFYNKWRVEGSHIAMFSGWDHDIEGNQQTVEESLRWLRQR